MNVETFIEKIQALQIHDFIGVPDSTLKSFCDYLNQNMSHAHHFVCVNEGAAVALGAGIYLGSGQTSCIYMQNSGIGNAVNPIASLINERVYDIPALFVIGYRGEPGGKDEPQHAFQGEITEPMLDCLAIEYAIISKDSDETALQDIFNKAKKALSNNRQFAIVVKKGTFAKTPAFPFENAFTLDREDAIQEILRFTQEDDIVVSTTGKISREVYEQCDALFQNHDRAFLTVGSMGHADMIALGIALKNPTRRIYCLDGDGAVLMHMGSMAFLAQQACKNIIHITLNNHAHESVGGMPTDCQGIDFADVAKACTYAHTFTVKSKEELSDVLHKATTLQGPIYIQVLVALGARDDLGRPKESAVENKQNFMRHIADRRSK